MDITISTHDLQVTENTRSSHDLLSCATYDIHMSSNGHHMISTHELPLSLCLKTGSENGKIYGTY